VLGCGRHKCPERCHRGPCDETCRLVITKSCRCGGLKKEVCILYSTFVKDRIIKNAKLSLDFRDNTSIGSLNAKIK
jgi:hypothetical protein